MSNPLQKIKQKQIADAIEKGEKNPYESPAVRVLDVATAPSRHNKLSQIKAQQLIDTPELYEQKPVFLGVDMAASGGDKTATMNINLFEQLKAAMVTDIARIKLVKKLEEKQAIKADLLPAYLPFVNNYVEQGHDYPNSVAVQVMVWLLDTNQIEQGLNIGLHLVKLGTQSLPVQFNRDIQTFIADAVYDWANEQLKANQSANPYLEQLATVMLEDSWDLHPAVISKTFAMLAKHAFAADLFIDAVAFCTISEKANPEGAGVKTLKAKAQKQIDNQIDKLAAEQAAETE